MDKKKIEEIINEPYKKITYEYFYNEYYIKEAYEYRKELKKIMIEIRCSLREEKSFNGWVDVTIDINNILENHVVGFGWLQVQTPVQNKGIGTTLMLKVIEIMKVFKEYYQVDELKLSGWLSQTDGQDGNWKDSIPFYEKVGQKAGVMTKFYIKNQDKAVSTKEEFFKEVGDSDGEINYYL